MKDNLNQPSLWKWSGILFIFLVFPCICLASMVVMLDNDLDHVYARGMSIIDDNDLGNITGQAGFSKITLTKKLDGARTFDVVRADLAVDIELVAQMEKFKMGYYPYSGQKGANIVVFGLQFPNTDNQSYASGWDIEWTGLKMGKSASEPMRLGGLVIRADFEEINGNKRLNRFIVGSDDVSGEVHADSMRSFTGKMNTKLAMGVFGVDWFDMKVWTRRTYILNGEAHGTFWEGTLKAVLGNVGQNGMLFKGISEGHGFYIVMDKDYGVGMWAGYPISDIDTANAFE